MKYTIKEQIKVSKIKKDLEKLKTIIHKKRKKIQSIVNEIDRIHDLEIKLAERICIIDAKVIKRCKHENGTHWVRNWRDDASFLYWIKCDDCGMIVDYEGKNESRFN